MGDFVTVGVMGGQQIASVGKIIQVQMSYLQFPAAAAQAMVLLGLVLLLIIALTRIVQPSGVCRVQALGMGAGIVVSVTPQARIRLEAIVATADGCATTEIMRRSGLSKPVVWRCQERFMQEGVDGLCCATRRASPASRRCPLRSSSA